MCYASKYRLPSHDVKQQDTAGVSPVFCQHRASVHYTVKSEINYQVKINLYLLLIIVIDKYNLWYFR